MHDWQPNGTLTVEGGQVAKWQLGGAAQMLPADENLHYIEFAPGYNQVLRYGNGTDGQVWRWAANGWVQERTLDGPIQDAVWTQYGILAGFEDGTSSLIDPESGDSRLLPSGTSVSGSSMLSSDSSCWATTETAVALWNLHEDRLLDSWPVPGGHLLSLLASSPDRGLIVYGSLGQIYVLHVDTTNSTLSQMWQSEQASVPRPGRAHLHPNLPLLAMVYNGADGNIDVLGGDFDVSVVDLEQGRILWQSTSEVAVAEQAFFHVQWSTDGLYLITQAKPPQPSTFKVNIGVWDWGRRLAASGLAAGNAFVGSAGRQPGYAVSASR